MNSAEILNELSGLLKVLFLMSQAHAAEPAAEYSNVSVTPSFTASESVEAREYALKNYLEELTKRGLEHQKDGGCGMVYSKDGTLVFLKMTEESELEKHDSFLMCYNPRLGQADSLRMVFLEGKPGEVTEFYQVWPGPVTTDSNPPKSPSSLTVE